MDETTQYPQNTHSARLATKADFAFTVESEEFVFNAKKDHKTEAEALPNKGKPTSFFIVYADADGDARNPSAEQVIFVYMYYPQYSANPVIILDWLYGQGYYNDHWWLK